MQAGDLNHQIQILRNAAADADGTDATPDWQPICTCYANKKGARGQLYFAAAAAQQTGDTLFSIRYRTDLAGAQRVVETVGGATHTYTIKGIPNDNDGTKQWLQFHGEEILQNGTQA